ncbi:NAD-dependent epimerase/dehydratase family protein [Paenibacillus endoradicis]|uniref:NAD-dependent epimerase/dehydratase family protein n=1 Tax=Paenibacillus endoradicis TaxID=2972487 RepID=UPI0021595326|nr:NAD(P)-dependent oxidoreductase [Paenibacillus endoradicis]MCR8659880.1 NAD(P)-dependent oxidoreductase [Paenibacillus endoradicis]
MKQPTVLISGANGYIAQHLIERLRTKQYQVTTASRGGNSDFYMDFSQPYQISLQDITNIDVMIHTVSPNEELYRTDPYRGLSENATGIHAALDFCVRNHIPRFIYFSSFHVFGKSVGALREQTSLAPINDYGLAHSVAEQTVAMYDRQQKVNTWIIRPSNLYGVPINCDAFTRWYLIPFNFCTQAVQHRSITLQSTGQQLRNFVAIQDVCCAVERIIEQRPVERIHHVYGKETLSVLQYAQLVQQIAWEKFKLEIDVKFAEGNEQVVTFDFGSEHPYEPKHTIAVFVEEMLSKLLAQQ